MTTENVYKASPFLVRYVPWLHAGATATNALGALAGVTSFSVG